MKQEDGSQKPEVRSQTTGLRVQTAGHTSFCILQSALSRTFILSILVGVLGGVSTVRAATSNAPAGSKKASAPATVSVGSAPAVVAVPKSSFGLGKASGKDPFYPNSVRLQEKIPVADTNQVAAVVPEVRINGFSGNAARPLVILNNLTFGEGDEQMVTTAAGRARVRCIAIRMQEQAVEIEINGLRRELKFLDRK